MSEQYKVYLVPGCFRASDYRRRSPKRKRTITSRYTCSFEKAEEPQKSTALLKIKLKKAK